MLENGEERLLQYEHRLKCMKMYLPMAKRLLKSLRIKEKCNLCLLHAELQVDLVFNLKVSSSQTDVDNSGDDWWSSFTQVCSLTPSSWRMVESGRKKLISSYFLSSLPLLMISVVSWHSVICLMIPFGYRWVSPFSYSVGTSTRETATI